MHCRTSAASHDGHASLECKRSSILNQGGKLKPGYEQYDDADKDIQ